MRFSTGKVNGKQTHKSMFFKGTKYPTESAVRKTLQHTVQIQNDTSEQIKVDAKFGAVTAIYRKDHLPGLHRSTEQTNSYFLNSYIEPRFADEPPRNVTPMGVLACPIFCTSVSVSVARR